MKLAVLLAPVLVLARASAQSPVVPPQGWHSGDTHMHMQFCGSNPPIDELSDTALIDAALGSIRTLMDTTDLNVANVLIWAKGDNSPYTNARPFDSFVVDQPSEGAVFLYAGRSTALAFVRNGDGTNPAGYSAVTQPVLGSPWLLDVDVTTPGHLGSLVSVGLGGAITGPHTSGHLQGQLLVRGPFLVDFAAGSHAIALPAEVALFGTTLATQAATFSAGVVRLNNAIDAMLGY